ncbi:px domain containing protein [Phytophthora cinnamomi]|uniref:px domain containing protein n=1 Tax=Phytophthora cinnamomi TaxID=4785 RepID=UPI003559988F|nr:px domain containing protein [Phytophthora cinnamomi]
MGGGSWVVQEGFLLVKRDEAASPRAESANPPQWKPAMGGGRGLKEFYVVLTMNRKLEFFDGSDADTRSKVDSAYLLGFAGWDGDGLLKADSYGLELKVERHAQPRMHLAAFNRVDQEKWCRGFMAALDPQSAAGEEVRRERRRVKKEEKRLQEEREEKIRKWKEKKARMIKEEQDRLLAREEEINNMTPLERVDGLGSLDDDTARMLEKRKLRLQRRQAPTTGRVNKAAYRRRLEEAAGGKTDNVQPLHTKIVEQKAKVRVELPPPGQFFEVGGIVHNDAPA